ncbi:MAG: hypothetical protein GY778_16940 [bacterium]|nr:hypothetical protein [bacterium]
MNPLRWGLFAVGVAGLWWLAVARNRRAVAALEGSGDSAAGIVLFVEPVRWLFIIWGFASFGRGLRRGGCGARLGLFRWSGRAGALLVLPDLMRQRRLSTKADRLARRIDRLAAEHPGTPVHLCGYSSGCYLVTEAVKRIKRPEAVGTVILLAGSMSPGYELDAVADRVRALHSFHSGADFLINGLGPWLVGCNDRQRALAAGMVGFAASRPAPVNQHGWSPRDVRMGYLGDHFSITASGFIAARVAPLLTNS